MRAERLRELRVSQGISQEHLANVLGVKQQTIGKWEKSITVPRLPMLQKIASYFNVSTDYLTGISDIPKFEPKQVTVNFDTELIITAEEESLIKAYRTASDRDKNLVDTILKPKDTDAAKKEVS